MPRRIFVALIALVACGGKIAPTDTFEDVTPGSSSSSSSGSVKRRPTPVPTHDTIKPPVPLPDGGVGDVPTGEPFQWVHELFNTEPGAHTDCILGEEYVSPSERYGVWVGLQLCSPTRYKIYLGTSRFGMFHEIADGAGHGQDHCELVNPKFTLPDEDDIKSGGCSSCNIDNAVFNERTGGRSVFDRAYFGSEFNYDPWPAGYYTVGWYECGVAIP